MKKKIIIVIVLLLMALIALIIPKSTYQKWFGKKQNEDNLTYNLLVYVEDSNNRVVGVSVPVKELEEDQIRQKWELLTINNSSLPENYKSSLPSDATLESYELIENELKIYTTESIKNANGRKAMETIAWTFIDDDIEYVSIYVEEELIDTFGEYRFKQINKQNGINFNYETLYLYESNATTMIYYEDELIVPVTYFHLEDDVCNYIVKKALEENEVSEQYNYTYEDSILTLDFVDASLLTANQITTIVESVEFNLKVDSLNINNNENIFYQVVFNEIEEDIQ